MKHLSEEDLILIYYNEPGIAPQSRAHLAECEHCRAASEALATTLSLCDEWEAPDPPPGTWMRLAPEIVGRAPRSARVPPVPLFSRPRFWIATGALATMLAGAFVTGRFYQPAQPILPAGLSSQARERILAIALADHLDRAEVLLTEVSNLNESDDSDFTSERERAQDLVKEGRLMRQTLAARDEMASVPLLDEIERFMLEVANSPDRIDPSQIREIKTRAGSDSLLFKVRILESNLRSQGQKI